MKNYGNMVRQYVPKMHELKYPDIVVDSLVDYQESQLEYLKKFMDLEIEADVAGNPSAQLKNHETHKKIVAQEIDRLKGQLGIQ